MARLKQKYSNAISNAVLLLRSITKSMRAMRLYANGGNRNVDNM
jgi:hypothetical protein